MIILKERPNLHTIIYQLKDLSKPVMARASELLLLGRRLLGGLARRLGRRRLASVLLGGRGGLLGGHFRSSFFCLFGT